MPKIIVFRQKGKFKKTSGFLKRVSRMDLDAVLDEYGKKGVAALVEATPKDTGKTAASWKNLQLRSLWTILTSILTLKNSSPRRTRRK